MLRTQRLLLIVSLFAFSCGESDPSDPNNSTTPNGDMGDAVADMHVADTSVSGDTGSENATPGDMSTAVDAGADAGQDAEIIDDMCIPESAASFCTARAAECGAASARDSCGRSRTENCGTCPAGEACLGNVCNCVPEVDALICQRVGATCGTVTQQDNCGATRNPNCGSCTPPQTCGGGGIANTCGCTPQTDAEFCAAMGRDCDTFTGTDNCGLMRSVDCGSCAAPQSCGGAGQAGVCGCTPSPDATLCAAAGAMCGAFTTTDDCAQARVLDCGGCVAPQTCGGGGTANQCGCTPETDGELCLAEGANCGQLTTTDRCGQSRTIQCGTCGAGESCGGAGTPNVCGCAPDSDATLCAAAGATCDSITVTDNCGAQRTAACGMCTDPDTCGGGGTPNQCGCTVPTQAEICQDRQASCGNVGAVVCGTGVVAMCGTCAVGTCDNSRNQCALSFTSAPGSAISDTLGTVTDSLVVSGCSQIAEVTVGVNISHTYRGDMDIYLRSPSNTAVLLHANATDPADDIIGVYPDTLTPAQSLDAFIGEAGNGTWTLEVTDLFAQDDGTLNSWTVNLFCL